MKTCLTCLFIAAAALVFPACDARVNVPPAESNTTIVNPPGEKKETTIINPPAVEKKTETTTTNTGAGTVEKKTETTR